MGKGGKGKGKVLNKNDKLTNHKMT